MTFNPSTISNILDCKFKKTLDCALVQKAPLAIEIKARLVFQSQPKFESRVPRVPPPTYTVTTNTTIEVFKL